MLLLQLVIEGVLRILVVLQLGLGAVAVLLVPMRLLQRLVHRMLRAPPICWVKRRLSVRIHRVPRLILALLLIEGRQRSGTAHLILLKVQVSAGKYKLLENIVFLKVQGYFWKYQGLVESARFFSKV